MDRLGIFIAAAGVLFLMFSWFIQDPISGRVGLFLGVLGLFGGVLLAFTPFLTS